MINASYKTPFPLVHSSKILKLEICEDFEI